MTPFNWFRHLDGEDITSLNYKELMAIEEALDNGLTNIRQKMVLDMQLLSLYNILSDYINKLFLTIYYFSYLPISERVLRDDEGKCKYIIISLLASQLCVCVCVRAHVVLELVYK